MSLAASLDAARAAVDAARLAPQSRKKAMLAALLLDAFVDELSAARGEGDVLMFRAALAVRHPALSQLLDLAAMERGGTSLVLEPVEVALGDYPALGVEDFMVSLYSGRTVPRVLIATDGRRADVHAALAAALAALEAEAAI